MLWLTIALYVVLSTSKVPHKVTPVHEVTLVRKEELHVLQLCRHLYAINIMTSNTAHPLFVLICRTWVVHTWEKHILLKHLCSLMTYNEVRVLLILRCFFLTLINWCPLIKLIVHTIFCNCWLT